MTIFLHPYHLDEYLPGLDSPLAPARTIRTDPGEGDTWDHLATLYRGVSRQVEQDIREGRVPVVTSGDCTTSYGVVAGMQHAGLSPVIVWFDAHGDVQTLETTGSGYIGGMPLRFLTGYRRDLVGDRIGLSDVDESSVVLVGSRDLDPPEVDYLTSAAIRRTDVTGISDDAIPDGPIYLHVDFDVVDPDDLPGLLYPASGGPSLGTVADAIERILATGRTRAVTLAATWDPSQGAADRVRDAAGPMLSALVSA